MRLRRSHDDAHGVSIKEQAIIDRLEAGESKVAIARSLGLRPSSVAMIARRYIIGDHQLNEGDRRTRASEARYRETLLATGKVYA